MQLFSEWRLTDRIGSSLIGGHGVHNSLEFRHWSDMCIRQLPRLGSRHPQMRTGAEAPVLKIERCTLSVLAATSDRQTGQSKAQQG